MNTWAPGTRTGSSLSANCRKNDRRASLWTSVRTVNLGRGRRAQPSKDGGMRHTPPLPFFIFSNWSWVYSSRPYGGSVTTPWTERRRAVRSHSSASACTTSYVPTCFLRYSKTSGRRTPEAHDADRFLGTSVLPPWLMRPVKPATRARMRSVAPAWTKRRRHLAPSRPSAADQLAQEGRLPNALSAGVLRAYQRPR